MQAMDLAEWEKKLQEKVASMDLGNDPAHDLAHFRRVVEAARKLALVEGARLEVVLPAAWLHDLVNVPKNDPRRSQASRLSADAAVRLLDEMGYPSQYLNDIAHAIEAHSYSAGIEPRTIEAEVVQDADRLDGLGAIGIARCFAVAAQLGGRFYDPRDPFARERGLDDRLNAVDHFYVKLLRIVELLRTQAGRVEGERRAEFMKAFLRQLGEEVGAGSPPC